jgi:hypothetical protein
VDGDGRPDLLFGGYFHTITTQTYVIFETYGVPLLLHSLPDGRFSMSDDIARRWAISSCPSPTPAGMSCLQSLSCMRLWGRSPKAMQAWEATATACRDANAELLPGVPPAAETFAKAPLPFRPLNESPPRPLPPTVPLVKAATEGAP